MRGEVTTCGDRRPIPVKARSSPKAEPPRCLLKARRRRRLLTQGVA